MHINRIAFVLVCCVLFAVMLFPLDSNAQSGASIQFSYNQASSQVTVKITSPNDISNVLVTMEIPQSITVSSFQLGGFISGALDDQVGSLYKWITPFASGGKEGSIVLNIIGPETDIYNITLREVVLRDTQDNVIPIVQQLPMTLNASSGSGSTPSGGSSTSTPVVPAGQFAVLSPNGAETIEGYTTFPITWTKLDRIGRIDLFYSRNNGHTWRQIARRRENTGTYNWKVPNEDIEKCLLRIDAYDPAGKKLTDTSDKPFKLKRIPQPGARCQ